MTGWFFDQQFFTSIQFKFFVSWSIDFWAQDMELKDWVTFLFAVTNGLHLPGIRRSGILFNINSLADLFRNCNCQMCPSGWPIWPGSTHAKHSGCSFTLMCRVSPPDDDSGGRCRADGAFAWETDRSRVVIWFTSQSSEGQVGYFSLSLWRSQPVWDIWHEAERAR